MTEPNASGEQPPLDLSLWLVDDVDLSGVDPLRRDEVRRRVAIVRSFLAMAVPGDADRRRHAAALDLSVNQFMALVRAWRQHPHARSVAGSGSMRGKRRKTGPRHLDPAVRERCEEIVAALDPKSSLASAVLAVAEGCSARNLAAPSNSTVWQMITKVRGARPSPRDRGVLVAGQCWVRLPVLYPNGLEMPRIGLVVQAEDGVVLAASMSTDPKRLTALAGIAGSVPDTTCLHLDRELPGALSAAAGDHVKRSSPATVRRLLGATLGKRIGGIQLVLLEGAQARPERLLRAAKDSPLDPEDARRVVRSALDASNATRGGANAIWID